MKKKWIKLIRGMMLMFVSLSMITPVDTANKTLAAQENSSNNEKIVRIGWYDLGSTGKIGEETNAHGYEYEYLQALSQYTNWKYEYVGGTWDECLEMLKNGEVDMMGFISKTEERKKIYGYAELPMGISKGLLVTDSDNTSFSLDEMISPEGITVGVTKGSSYNKEFKKYCKENGYKVKLREYLSLADIPKALEKHEVQAAVVADEDKTDTERVVFDFAPSNQYYATNINNKELLAELNSAMSQVNRFCPNLNSDLYQKYFSLNSNGSPLFTAAEQMFIKEHPQINVMYDSGWPPIEYLDEETGEYKGISPDVFKLLSDKCGIQFVYEGSTSGQVLDTVEEEEPKNVITTISYNYYWADTHNVRITQPFITSKIVKIGKNLNEKKAVVAMNKKAYFSYLLKDELEGVTLLQCDKQIERFDAVLSGKADYTYCTADQANYYKTIPKYKNLKTQEMLDYEQQVCISVSKNSDPELMSIISKGLDSITHDEMSEIIRKNTEVSYTPKFSDILYMYPGTLLAISVGICAVIFILFLRMYVNRQKRIVSERENEAKSNLLARMSHDMRTPLNGILGMTRMALKTDGVTEEAKECMGNVESSATYLMTLINDILDISKYESGKMQITTKPVTQIALLHVILPISKQLADEKNITFTHSIQGREDIVLMVDVQHMSQVIMNILSNAFKYTPENGKVSFDVSIAEPNEGKVHVTYRISDNGIGMKKEFQKEMFEPFVQENSANMAGQQSTGLGLAIVKRLLRLMDGTIMVESEPHRGSTFIISLDYDISQDDVEEQKAAFRDMLCGKRVLIFEDNNLNAQITSALLEEAGVFSETAENGKVGLAMFLTSEEWYYDAILMDKQMPVMDGEEATKRIRKSKRKDSKKISIISLSANEIDTHKRRRSGDLMNDHLTKPLDARKMYISLCRCIAEQNR